MADPISVAGEGSGFTDMVVKINRTAKVVAGGRRFGFSALVVVGNHAGKVGWGFGKANEVQAAIQKATKAAQRNIVPVRLEGDTIAHEVEGRFASARVHIRPARPGTGVTAGGAVRMVFEAAGVRNVLSKARGSTNPLNLLKATFDAIGKLRSRQEIEALRGVSLDAFEMGARRRKAWL